MTKLPAFANFLSSAGFYACEFQRPDYFCRMNLPNEGTPPKRDAAGPKKFEELHRNVTMSHIAKAANVSQGAISSMLNDRNYGIRVSEKTRAHVFKVCREMGYIPNDLRALVRMYPELGGYCLLIASDIAGGLSDPLVARIAAAALKALPDATQGLNVGYYDPAVDYQENAAAAPQAVSSYVYSKFLVVGTPNRSLVDHLTRRGLSVMSLGYELEQPGLVNFVPDYALASRLALEHFGKLGHRNFGIVSGPFGSMDARVLDFNRGVRLACGALNLPLDAQHIIYGDLSVEAGHTALDELLARSPQPTAVFCMSDAAAIGLIERAQARGIAVPEKLSVIGCGDEPAAQHSYPSLTTVRLPAEEMAELAVAEVDLLVHDDLPTISRKIALPVTLVERRSCAPLIPA